MGIEVTVRCYDQEKEHAFYVDDAKDLFNRVDNSRHFLRGGQLELLEDDEEVSIGRSYPLRDGMKFVWYPPKLGEVLAV